MGYSTNHRHSSRGRMPAALTAPLLTLLALGSPIDAIAQDAGFVLEARSELNANPKDDHDHPFGVWTLPPVRRSSDDQGRTLSADERAAFDAIGESDRMTLRFRKPE